MQKGELVIMPRFEYEEVAKIIKRLLWEEKDTDEAILIFEKEHKANRLKMATSFSEILGIKRRRSK